MPVIAMVRLDEDGDDTDVFLLNDLTYRDSTSANFPWQPMETSGTPASSATVLEVAIEAVGPGARVIELKCVRAGRATWDASVVDVQGIEHSVLLGADGAVLDLRKGTDPPWRRCS